MIGWVILAALLIPALALGRWADRERRRARSEEPLRPEVVTSPARARAGAHRAGRPMRSTLTAGRVVHRSAARRSRPYAGR
ncbi:MAG TPA: hypothetical protein VNV17_00025 [Solirubrobacteraceae bacterium]|nr:hypothetical protein [Polyangia bacterium]HXD62970.1 hypothetical protein [Solirubrobacteraceae bacterium]